MSSTLVLGRRARITILRAQPRGAVLERRVASRIGRWSRWSRLGAARAGSSYLVALAPGSTVCVRIRVGTRILRPRCLTALLDAPLLRGRGTTTVRHAYAAGGSLLTARRARARITVPMVRADGIDIRVYACADCGRVALRVNGRIRSTVSTRRRDAGFRTIAMTRFPRTFRGRIELVAVDTGRVVRIDGIVLRRTRG